MKNRKFLILVSVIIMSVAALLSCSKPGELPTKKDVFSEGVDTPVTIVSYSNFSEPDDYFLKEGDKIAVIAASALPSKAQIKAAEEGLEKWGYVPVEGKYVSVEERTLDECIEDLTWALTDPEIRAILSVRGGHASSEVLDILQMSLIKNSGKTIIGASDITAYLSAWTVSGLPSIHFPTWSGFAGDLPDEYTDVLQKMMRGEIPSYKCQGSEYDIPGSAEGILIGGNLSPLTTVLNTEYDCTAIEEPFILFLEDLEEDYEHIHRYLTVLKHEGILDKAAGLVFGEWVDIPAECNTYNGNSRGGKFKSVADMISREFLEGKQIPVAFGFPAGHGNKNYPLLIGAKVRLNVREDDFTIEWVTSGSLK